MGAGAHLATALGLIAAGAAALLAVPGAASAQPRPVDAAIDAGSGAAAIATAEGVWLRARRGAPFVYVCPRLAGSEARAFEPRVATAGGRAFVASHRGLRVGEPCAMEPATFRAGPGSRPRVSIWVSSIEAGSDGALWAATADGNGVNDVYRAAAGEPRRFESVGLRSERRWYLSALPAPSAPRLAYVSGYQVAPARAALYRVGPAGAAELSTEGVRFGRSRRSHFVAVDPADPGVAFLRAEAVTEPGGDRLYRLAGGRFAEVLAPGGAITGAVSRGAEVWVASRAPCPDSDQPGCLYRSRDGGRRFETAIGGPALDCLIEGGDELLGCRADSPSSGVALLAIDAAGRARPFLRTTEVAPPCARRCASAWRRACRQLGADCEAPLTAPPPPSPQPRPERWPWLVAILAALAALPWFLRR